MEKKELFKVTKKLFIQYYLSLFVFTVLITSCSHDADRKISSTSEECSFSERKNEEGKCVGRLPESIRSHKEAF